MNIFKSYCYILLNYFAESLCQYVFPLPEYEGMNFIPLLAEKFGLSGVFDQRKSNLEAVGEGWEEEMLEPYSNLEVP